jgi:hypothetical protein
MNLNNLLNPYHKQRNKEAVAAQKAQRPMSRSEATAQREMLSRNSRRQQKNARN